MQPQAIDRESSMSTPDFAAVKKEILEKGWIKGHLRSDEGCCLVGSLVNVLSPLEEMLDAWDDMKAILGEVIKEQFPDRISPIRAPIPVFNDHPATTLEEVFSVLDKAQVRLEERI
jgi:hypothetical protein